MKKFLSGIVSRTAIDSSIVERGGTSPDHVNFTRFLAQNIAFFDYKKLDELLHVVLQLELAYSKSGGEIAAQIETSERIHPKMVVHKTVPGNLELDVEPTTVEEETLEADSVDETLEARMPGKPKPKPKPKPEPETPPPTLADFKKQFGTVAPDSCLFYSKAGSERQIMAERDGRDYLRGYEILDERWKDRAWFDEKKKTIVVVGSGWGATSFLRKLDTDDYNVVRM